MIDPKIGLYVTQVVMLGLSIPLTIHLWRQWRRYRKTYMLAATSLFDRLAFGILLAASSEMYFHAKAGTFGHWQYIISALLAFVMYLYVYDRTRVYRAAISLWFGGRPWGESLKVAREVEAKVNASLRSEEERLRR